MSPGLTAMTDRAAAAGPFTKAAGLLADLGFRKIRAAVGASDDLGRAAGRHGVGETTITPAPPRRTAPVQVAQVPPGGGRRL